MSHWYQTETPFGRIAFTVRFDGSMWIQPHAADLAPYKDHRTGETHPSIVSGDQGTLTINGREYSGSFDFELSTRTTRNESGEWVDAYNIRAPYAHFTTAAWTKLNAWLNAHHSELATGERRAQGRFDAAASSEYYKRDELGKLQGEYDIVKAELDAARANLDGYSA